MWLCVTVAVGMQPAVAAVSPAGFPVLLQRPASIAPDMLAAEQHRRPAPPPATQHYVTASLAGRVRASLHCIRTHVTDPRGAELEDSGKS